MQRLLRVRDVLWCLLAATLTVALMDAGIIAATSSVRNIIPAASGRLVAVQANVQDFVIVKPTRLTERAAPWKPVIYSVHPGDNLSTIAQQEYGRQDTWTVIYWANHKSIKYASLIYPGQRLSVPALPARIPAPPAILSPVAITVTSVTHTSSSDSDGSTSSSHPDRLVSPPGIPPVSHSGYYDPAGTCTDSRHCYLTEYQIERLWVSVGGPAWAEAAAYRVTTCESGHNRLAYNPSGATGLWQILGQVVFTGSLYDARVNAQNAVSKFTASGDRWSQWVCQP